MVTIWRQTGDSRRVYIGERRETDPPIRDSSHLPGLGGKPDGGVKIGPASLVDSYELGDLLVHEVRLRTLSSPIIMKTGGS